MLINSSKMMFFFMLILGSMISFSSNSWFGAWMGLEINLLSFIPLVSDNSLMSTEASLKYFLTQALASTTLLFSSIFLLSNKNFSSPLLYINNMLILSSLMLKSGSAPFHFWFPNVMEGLTWMNALILMTWQKFAPLMLMTYVMIKEMFIMSVMISSIVSMLGAMNQTSLRKLMAYSSINHLAWMMSAMMMNNLMWMIYFIFYVFLSINLLWLFNIMNIFYMPQLYSSFNKSKTLKFILFFNLLSLGGLPPFIGFIPKWIVINSLVENMNYFLVNYLLIMTLIILYLYIRLCYSAFMLNHSEMKWLNMENNHFMNFNWYLTYSYISTFGLILISLFYLMY
uniref:NADH-ubiquinone oxidoreductase chain 2 n=1 Tax=Chamaemyia juncorum TaxID=1979291 RepID=A0A1W5YKB5_9MUSC|nr:NADH dehydrogenase subunit 2 [Chamaemyia juncorum]